MFCDARRALQRVRPQCFTAGEMWTYHPAMPPPASGRERRRWLARSGRYDDMRLVQGKGLSRGTQKGDTMRDRNWKPDENGVPRSDCDNCIEQSNCDEAYHGLYCHLKWSRWWRRCTGHPRLVRRASRQSKHDHHPDKQATKCGEAMRDRPTPLQAAILGELLDGGHCISPGNPYCRVHRVTWNSMLRKRLLEWWGPELVISDFGVEAYNDHQARCIRGWERKERH